MISGILKVGIQKLRKVKELAQGHVVRKRSQDLNLIMSDYKLLVLHYSTQYFKKFESRDHKSIFLFIHLSTLPSILPSVCLLVLPSIYPVTHSSLLPSIPPSHQPSSHFYSFSYPSSLPDSLPFFILPLFNFLSCHQFIHPRDIY